MLCRVCTPPLSTLPPPPPILPRLSIQANAEASSTGFVRLASGESSAAGGMRRVLTAAEAFAEEEDASDALSMVSAQSVAEQMLYVAILY